MQKKHVTLYMCSLSFPYSEKQNGDIRFSGVTRRNFAQELNRLKMSAEKALKIQTKWVNV